MKTISVTDLQLFPELSHLRMLDFINPENDSLIAPFLKIIGIDLDYHITYLPCKHRNLQGKEVIAYIIVGELECNDSFLSSPFATSEDRIIAAGYTDLSLSQEMVGQLTSLREYEGSQEGFPPDLSNPDEAEIVAQVKTLADLLLSVRGSPFKQDGSRATMAEYGIAEKLEKVRRKSVKRVA